MLWFLAGMLVFYLEVPVLAAARASEVKGVEWTWISAMFATLGFAAVVAVAGLVYASIAIVRRGERSWMLLLPILLGILVLTFAIGEALGQGEPTSSRPGATTTSSGQAGT